MGTTSQRHRLTAVLSTLAAGAALAFPAGALADLTAPTAVKATPGNGRISLTWSPPAEGGITGYVIYRDWVSLGLKSTTPSFVDTGLANGTSRYYNIRAVDAQGVQGAASTRVAAIPTPLSAPAGLTVTPADGRVTLTWTAPTDPTVHGHVIYRDGRVITMQGRTSSFVDDGLANGHSHTYMVKSVDDTTMSPESATVSGTPASAENRLSWKPPTLTNPTTINVTTARQWYGLDPARDYIVKMPSTTYNRAGLNIEGGRNVVMIGGHISAPAVPMGSPMSDRRGLLFVGQRGTLHVEGLLIDGPGLAEGIDLDERFNATVQIENNRVGPVKAWDEVNFTDNHPDDLQTWAGPGELRVDKFTGITDYQGLMMGPTDVGNYPARLITLKRINIKSLPTGLKLFNKKGADPMTYSDLWAEPSATPTYKVWTQVNPTASWTNVQQNVRPEGDFVPAGATGLNYQASSDYVR